MTISAIDFERDFHALTGHAPFPWQRRLFRYLRDANLPPAVDIPTGLGKTAVMAIWLLARSCTSGLPRRLVYVVDRRAVVDQATEFAERLRKALCGESLEHVRRGLGLCDRPLPISTLRGQFVDNREWLEDPAGPAIVVGTVDMVGSRLLFEGYGVSRRMRPYAAGLMGCDSLVMLDEAHLARPFERLLRTIEEERRVTAANDGGVTAGKLAGPMASAILPPPFHVLPLSATLVGDSTDGQFRLSDEDRRHEDVRERLEAVKTLTVEALDKDAKLEQALAERAWRLGHEGDGVASEPARVLIYCAARLVAEKVAEDLRKRAKTATPQPEILLFVGGRRVQERVNAAAQLRENGFIAGSGARLDASVYLVATSAGEVGVDLDADHMVCDLVAWERMVQRLGRVNRRGSGRARVFVLDRPLDEKKADKERLDRLSAVRELLSALPPCDTGGRRAGPAALTALGDDPVLRERIEDASTPMVLYPALTRPLVDAWAMTALAEHTGRPEVGPWLRGWADNEPQTTVIWRRYLPVRFENDGSIHVPGKGEIEAFFEAAAPQAVERLETETWRVADWLKKRVRKLLGRKRDRDDDDTTNDATAPGAGNREFLRPMAPETPIVFLFGDGGKFEAAFKMKEIGELKSKDLERRLVGRDLAVDARLGGVTEGLLDPANDETVPTIEDDWGRPASGEREENSPSIRVRALSDDELQGERREREDIGRSSHRWIEALAAEYHVSPEGEVPAWLVVEKRRGGEGGEEARAVSSRAQSLDEHGLWAAKEAGRIAEGIGLSPDDKAMLVAAARHHDDGKKAARWQRAFKAKSEGGPYAKTAGPIDRRVLNGYRHEFQSVIDAERDGLDGLNGSDSRFELALHLIAAHHGNARPTIGIDGCDSLPPTAAASHAREIALRFARLQRRWGPWGLAWWEALLRAADQRASRKLDELEIRRKDAPTSGAAEAAAQGELFVGVVKEVD